MKTLTPGDKLNCYVIDRNGQQSNLAIQMLVVATKQSLYADGLYSTVLCIIDERIEQLLEDHQGEEMTPLSVLYVAMISPLGRYNSGRQVVPGGLFLFNHLFFRS